MRLLMIGVATALVAALASAAAIPSEIEDDIATGERLAALLRAGRSVVSNNQALINDAGIGEKNLGGEQVVDQALAIYKEHEGVAPAEGASDEERRLIDAQLEAMREVVDEHQELIDAKGLGFKGFIPALFARLVNERLEEKEGNVARVKVTAPPELVRNRKARPDDWELSVIQTMFLKPDWPKGKAYTERVESDGRPAFRMLIPEYYSASCLSCHGEPKGEMDITGYPKEGASEGDLSGAISITLWK